MGRPQSLSAGDFVSQQLGLGHDSSQEAEYADKGAMLPQAGDRSFQDEAFLRNEDQSKPNMKLPQMRENPKFQYFPNPETDKRNWDMYGERGDRLQEHYDRLAAIQYKYRRGVPPNEWGDYNKGMSHNFMDGNMPMPRMQGELFKNFEPPLQKRTFAQNFQPTKASKQNARQFVSMTHEILEDAFKRSNGINERRPYAKDINGSQFDKIPSNAPRVEGRASIGGATLSRHIPLGGHQSSYKNLSMFNDIVQNFERERSIEKRASGTNQSISNNYHGQSLMVEREVNGELHTSNKTDYQEPNVKKEDLFQGDEVLGEQLNEETSGDEKANLRAASSLHEPMPKSSHSLKSYSTTTSKLTLKSIKKFEESLELQRKKCSLMNVIDRSISMTKMDRKSSNTKTTISKIDENDKNSNSHIAASDDDGEIRKSSKDKAVKDVLHSEILTNIVKDCRDYHLQNIQQEVKRILYLEELPEKIKKSVK